jgi:hypothetical protein
MKQELIKTKLMITAVCAFGAGIILAMFAAAGYL